MKKTYIKPSVKIVTLPEPMLGPGAGDASNPNVGGANENLIFDEQYNDPSAGGSLWD